LTETKGGQERESGLREHHQGEYNAEFHKKHGKAIRANIALFEGSFALLSLAVKKSQATWDDNTP